MGTIADSLKKINEDPPTYKLPSESMFAWDVIDSWDNHDGKLLGMAFGSAKPMYQWAVANAHLFSSCRNHGDARTVLVAEARRRIADGTDLSPSPSKIPANGDTQDPQDSRTLKILSDSQDSQRPSAGGVPPLPSKEEEPQADVPAKVPSKTEMLRSNRAERGEWFANFRKCPINEYLVRAYEFNADHGPQHDGGTFEDSWFSPVFWFVWLLRGHDDLQAYLDKPANVVRLVEGALSAWTKDAKTKGRTPPHGFNSRDPWADWFGLTRADAVAEFYDVWGKIRFRPGHGPLEQAADAARRMRLQLAPDVVMRRPVQPGDEHGYEFFVNVAGHLQVITGNQAICLPCEKLGGIMGVTKRTIARYRQWAIEDGYLRQTKAHFRRAPGKGDATEFRFDTSRWKCLSEKAQDGTNAAFKYGA